MQTVSPAKVVTASVAVEEPLPPRIQEALGQLVGAAKEGLLALSVGVAGSIGPYAGRRAGTSTIVSKV